MKTLSSFLISMLLAISHTHATSEIASNLSDEEFVTQSSPYFTYCYRQVERTRIVDAYEFFYRRHKIHKQVIRIFRVNYGRGTFNAENHLVDLVRQRILKPNLLQASVNDNDIRLTLAIPTRVVPELFDQPEAEPLIARLENLASDNSATFYFLDPVSDNKWFCPTSFPFDSSQIFTLNSFIE